MLTARISVHPHVKYRHRDNSRVDLLSLSASEFLLFVLLTLEIQEEELDIFRLISLSLSDSFIPEER